MKLFHYAQRAYQLGVVKTVRIARERYNIARWHSHARIMHRDKARHAWSQIVRLHSVRGSFEQMHARMIQREEQLYVTVAQQLQQYHEQALSDAKMTQQGIYDILGSGPVQCSTIPWDLDIRHAVQYGTRVPFDTTSYYADIQITEGSGHVLAPDIKVPWELARCQHLIAIVYALQQTGDSEYRTVFIDHVTDFYARNPYLHGIAWLCPMEVAIRALNLITAWSLIKYDPEIENTFWMFYYEGLYDHLVYLENNWEYYDSKTSNHYLSDLVGYFALTIFFAELSGMQKKTQWVHAEIIQELLVQLNPDGTDYEGSTAYHSLVSELVDIWHTLAETHQLAIPAGLESRITHMREYRDACEYASNRIVHIGDNDSGAILYKNIGSNDNIQKADLRVRKNFPDAGISIYRDEHAHVTMRHYVHRENRPTAHLHNDWLSVTFAYNGVLLIADPGSYIYTPSVSWRNLFRSAKSHSAITINDEEPALFDDRLFALEVPAGASIVNCNVADTGCEMQSAHDLYARHGVTLERTVRYMSEDESVLHIIDRVQKKSVEQIRATWHIHLGPNIDAVHTENGYTLVHNGIPLTIVETPDLLLVKESGWYSPSYGTSMPTVVLRARHLINATDITTRISIKILC